MEKFDKSDIVELQENDMACSKLISFTEAARPLIKWLAENVHPHHTAIVTCTNAELLEGECCTGEILDYLKD